MATRDVAPQVDNEGGIGTALKRWASAFIAAITCTTINALTLAAASVGFTISGGTTSKTLTVDETVAISDKAPKVSPTFTGAATIPTVNLTGGQVAFPVAQAPSANANTLDDYEEGTWSPQLVGSTGTPGTWAQTVALAVYTKIGRQVTILAWITLDNIGSYTGAAQINGLPFTALINNYACGLVDARGFTFAGYPISRVSADGTFLNIIICQSNQGDGPMNYSAFENGDGLMINLTYFV